MHSLPRAQLPPRVLLAQQWNRVISWTRHSQWGLFPGTGRPASLSAAVLLFAGWLVVASDVWSGAIHSWKTWKSGKLLLKTFALDLFFGHEKRWTIFLSSRIIGSGLELPRKQLCRTCPYLFAEKTNCIKQIQIQSQRNDILNWKLESIQAAEVNSHASGPPSLFRGLQV